VNTVAPGRCRSGRFLSIGLLALQMMVPAARADAPPPPDRARERQSLTTVCSKCHNLQLVADTPRDFDAWQDTVQKMVDRGARGTDAQFDDVMDYLHRNLTTIDVNTAAADELGTVLDVSEAVANAIIARRTARKFSDLNDLKTVPGVDASILEVKARLVFF
jgi:competence protein ComEA